MVRQSVQMWLVAVTCVVAAMMGESMAAAESDTPSATTEDAATEATQKKDIDRLPAPLDRVVGDIDQIERTGFFKVERVERGRTEDYEEDTTVWTVRVVRPLTCRHALMLLQQFRDVRFYDTAQGMHRELTTTLLYYPLRLEMGAVEDALLEAGEEFQVWILLSERETRRLLVQGVDTVEFRRWKWR